MTTAAAGRFAYWTGIVGSFLTAIEFVYQHGAALVSWGARMLIEGHPNLSNALPLISGAFSCLSFYVYYRARKSERLGVAATPTSRSLNFWVRRPNFSARVVSVASMTGEDGGYCAEIEIKMKPGRRPVEVRWLRIEWHDGAEPPPDETLAANAQVPFETRAPFLLERAGARLVAFSIPSPWRSRGKGRVVAMVGTEEVASDWFPMLASRR